MCFNPQLYRTVHLATVLDEGAAVEDVVLSPESTIGAAELEAAGISEGKVVSASVLCVFVVSTGIDTGVLLASSEVDTLGSVVLSEYIAFVVSTTGVLLLGSSETYRLLLLLAALAVF